MSRPGIDGAEEREIQHFLKEWDSENGQICFLTDVPVAL